MKSGRPKGADSEARREQILADSTELFIEHGYYGVTMSMVARACGISPTGLAHYFATKDQLLEAILHRRDELDRKNVDLVSDSAAATGWEHFRWLVALARHNERQPRMLRLYTTMAAEATNPEHPARQWLLDHHRNAREDMVRSCQEAIEAGQLRADAPVEDIVRLLIGALDGLQLQFLSDARFSSMGDTFEVLVDALYERYKA
ncbi:TetR/AcrR family transcriptional regulator [Glutamicibacter endophyticus]